MEAAMILKNTENNKIKKLILFLKLLHTYKHLTHVVIVCFANNLFVGLFYKICSFY